MYAGAGGNRTLWGDKHDITAVEIDTEIAKFYKTRFPRDDVITGDAHDFLLLHSGEFDFIWSSPPCPSHSRMRPVLLAQGFPPVYPDMSLYQEIIFLKHFCKGLKWIVENVVPYYAPLIAADFKIGRHNLWTNFAVEKTSTETSKIGRFTTREHREQKGIDLRGTAIKNKQSVYRSCIMPKFGLHILECATR